MKGVKKLSPHMERVLHLLAQGWVLKQSTRVHNTTVWLQRSGGRESEVVRLSTLYALYDRGLLVRVESGFPVERHGLSSLGRQYVREHGLGDETT